jgi:6-pyruvoyltetrahydropterin/6-carboxytetrahydropterin synthase
MYEVTVEADFSSGHYLRNYKGKCENPHGHNYKVRVIERIDHQMLNDLEPFTVLNPSAENLAKYFYDETNLHLADVTAGRVRVKDCTIWETDTTTATYYE